VQSTVQSGGPDGVRLVLMEEKDGGERDREAWVVQNSTEERRSSFEKLDPNSYPNLVVDTVGEGVGRCKLSVGRENKDNTSMEAIRFRVNSSKIWASTEVKAEGKRRGRREEGGKHSFPPNMVAEPEGWSEESLGGTSAFRSKSRANFTLFRPSI